jgi:hypothetical protein
MDSILDRLDHRTAERPCHRRSRHASPLHVTDKLQDPLELLEVPGREPYVPFTYLR